MHKTLSFAVMHFTIACAVAHGLSGSLLVGAVPSRWSSRR